MAQKPKEKHEVEDLFCSCLFPDKYQGASGIWYCGKCGGITDHYDKRKADDHEDILDYGMFGNSFLSCGSCKTITWFMNTTHVEQQIKNFQKVYCPNCGVKHQTKGMLK